ncbi:MAG: NYN domain-containing protein [Alphaproteobacteria bacterium]|nr:NYN domain-containing protein [Alphaproteobacteria bacterium]MCW5752621.1 NYN domain-containing protein [Alphaproteobacteria bacterium]
MSKTRIAVLIDGGYLRKSAERARYRYNPNFIEKIAVLCASLDEELYRVLYYDCAPFSGKVTLPVSGETTEFAGSDKWLHDLGRRKLFAVRRGVLKFRGWRPNSIPIGGGSGLQDSDFSPVFEQKGVDMRIGLDIATLAASRSVSRVAVLGADTDLIPAMKHGRIQGLQIVGILLPNGKPNWEFMAHVDIPRAIRWPQHGDYSTPTGDAGHLP